MSQAPHDPVVVALVGDLQQDPKLCLVADSTNVVDLQPVPESDAVSRTNSAHRGLNDDASPLRSLLTGAVIHPTDEDVSQARFAETPDHELYFSI